MVAQTGSSGTVIAGTQAIYDAWGGVHGITMQDGPGYTGHVEDAATGLVYMQQRYYDPNVGRFLSMDPVDADGKVGGNLDRYWYAKDNPYRYTDPDGRDTRVELRYYIMGSAPIQGAYGHQYVYMQDTKTGETVISRGGPSEHYRAGLSPVASNSAEKSATGSGNITIRTTMTPAAKSPDAGEKSQAVPGSAVTLKEDIGEAKSVLSKFNSAVDSAKISYQPRSTNSNAYAGTAYQVVTGKQAPSMHALPGSDINLKPKIPACAKPGACGH